MDVGNEGKVTHEKSFLGRRSPGDLLLQLLDVSNKDRNGNDIYYRYHGLFVENASQTYILENLTLI